MFLSIASWNSSKSPVSKLPATSLDDPGPHRKDEEGGDCPFRAAIGCLIGLASMTRPDIANAVRAMARHSHNSCPRHWSGVLTILSYLNNIRSLGIIYPRRLVLAMDVTLILISRRNL